MAGIAYAALFLAFAVALTTLAAGLARGLIGATVITLAALSLLGLLGSFGILAEWLPSHLIGALNALARGAAPADYLPAVTVTVGLGAIAVAAAVPLLARRDLAVAVSPWPAEHHRVWSPPERGAQQERRSVPSWHQGQRSGQKAGGR